MIFIFGSTIFGIIDSLMVSSIFPKDHDQISDSFYLHFEKEFSLTKYIMS